MRRCGVRRRSSEVWSCYPYYNSVIVSETDPTYGEGALPLELCMKFLELDLLFDRVLSIADETQADIIWILPCTL